MLIHLFLVLGLGFAIGVVLIEKTDSKHYDMWGVGIFFAFMYAIFDTSSRFGSEVAFLAFVSLIVGIALAAKYWSKS